MFFSQVILLNHDLAESERYGRRTRIEEILSHFSVLFRYFFSDKPNNRQSDSTTAFAINHTVTLFPKVHRVSNSKFHFRLNNKSANDV